MACNCSGKKNGGDKMNRMQAISRLVRLPNLIMVILTMYLMRWSIVRPLLDLLGFDPVMPEWSFALLVFSTVMITAAGNVINDFHDSPAMYIPCGVRMFWEHQTGQLNLGGRGSFRIHSSPTITHVYIHFAYHRKATHNF